MLLLGFSIGMQYGYHAHFQPESLHHPDFQRFRRRAHHDVEYFFLVALHQVKQHMGQGHHHVAVRDTQQLVFHAYRPFERVTSAACGAETVLAAMIDFPDFATFGTGISIYPQSGGMAYTDGVCRLVLFGGDILCRMLGVLVPPTVEIVRQTVLLFSAAAFRLFRYVE